MKKKYIQPSAEFEEIEGLNDLMDQESARVMSGETTSTGYTTTPQGDVKEVTDDTSEDDLGLGW